MGTYRLSDLLDLTMIQKMAETHYQAAGIPIGIVDAHDGSILVGAGWQDICVKFHRANPLSRRRCQQSDNFIKSNLVVGAACRYKCKNGLWDIGIPIVVSGQHLATLFLGQFFYEGEIPDRDFFVQMARQYGFSVADYLAALDRVPVLNRGIIDCILEYDKALVRFITDLAEQSLSKMKADEESSRSERKFHAIFDQASHFLAILSTEGRVLEANRTALQYQGVKPQDVIGKLFWQTPWWQHSPESADNVRLAIEQAAAGELAQFEARLRASDGRIQFLDFTVKPVTNAAGEVGLLVPEGKDVTESRLNQEKIRQQAEFLQLLIDAMPYPVFYKDRQGRYISCNTTFEQFYGLPRERIAGKTVYEIAPKELADVYSQADKALFNNPEVQNYEASVKTAEGKGRDVIFHKATFKGEDGNIAGLVGTIIDITERKRIEKALSESEERYRKLVELSPDSIFIHTEGKFVFLNTSAATLLGAKRPEDLYGMVALDFVHPGQRDAIGKRIENAQSGGDNPRIEEQLVRLDGEIVSVEMESVYFNYQGKNSVLSIARDISEQKKMQDEFIKAQKLESLGVLAGGIAHDFNNLLTGILGNISLARQQLDASNCIGARLESCEKAAVRASELTRQLLTFARGGEPIKALVNPGPLIEENAAFVLRGSKVRCEVVLADDLWSIDADAGQISQVLHNMLINSIQAMPEGGVIRLMAQNEVLETANTANLPAGDYLNIQIEDHGGGISSENISRIFDPYFTTKSEGSGLGLASVYSIIHRHGGSIEVTSTVGQGSIFIIHLPAVSEKNPENEVEQTGTVLPGSGRILVMDDEEIIREMAEEILRFAGYQVHSCENGKQAVDVYRKAYGQNRCFDAVIMDLTVPGGMGGVEAAGLILKIDPEAVLIVSSGYSNDPVVAKYLQYGFRGAVVKPFSAGSLVTEVRRMIGMFS